MNSSPNSGQRQLNNGRRPPQERTPDRQPSGKRLQKPRPDTPQSGIQGQRPQNKRNVSPATPRYSTQGQRPQPPRQPIQRGAAPQGNAAPRGVNSRGAPAVRRDNRAPTTVKQSAPGKRPQNTTVSSHARTQTPANRRAEREKRRIDPRQIEINRRRREMHKFYVRRKRKNAFKVFMGRAVIFLIMFAIIFAGACGVTMLRFYSYKTQGGGEITYQIGADENADKTIRKLAYDSVVKDGCVYINITEIALLCEFTTTGDLNEIKLISKNESNDNVKLTMNSPVIYINTLPVRLQAPVYKNGEAIYIPLDFISGYVTGITAEYDAEKAKITILREVTGHTEATFTNPSVPIYADVCFTLKKPVPTDNIPEDSLDEDIRIATEPQQATDTGDSSGAQ